MCIWVDGHGRRIDLRSTCPRTVLRLLCRAIEHLQWRLISRGQGLSHLAQGARLGPIRRLLSQEGAHWHAWERPKLFTAVTGGLWTEARLQECGYLGRGICLACGAEPGTARHLIWRCDATEAARTQWAPAECLRWAAAAWDGSPVWSRALVVGPEPVGATPIA